MLHSTIMISSAQRVIGSIRKKLSILSEYVLENRSLSVVVQEPKEKRSGSLSFNSRVWQPCGSKYTFMFL